MKQQIGGRVAALCDVNRHKEAKSFELHPDVPKYEDFRVMIDEMQGKLDAVVVATGRQAIGQHQGRPVLSLVTAAMLGTDRRDPPEPPPGPVADLVAAAVVAGGAALVALFDGNPVIGSAVVGGAARAWSDLRIHTDGFFRIMVRDCSMSENQAGRLAKRLMDINCYRALALLGLPLAREVSPALSDADRRLALVASRMTTQGPVSDPGFESELLAELTASYPKAFVDLGVINAQGRHLAYVGPYELTGKASFIASHPSGAACASSTRPGPAPGP